LNPLGALGQSSLLISDLTTHELLNGSLDNIPTHLNSMVIELVLWDEHSKRSSFLKIGDYCLFKNLRPKLDNNNFLELNLHGDKHINMSSHKFSLLFDNDDDVIQMKMFQNFDF
jgi:hypothetical protein